ncbi:MAG: hypothetical protein CM1200mP2_54790 [Planctomycetaceae bacterium]|nr:MAG: hypothetical protein CM1200mP2_54790 [Planctomycetaceae bacterium]
MSQETAQDVSSPPLAPAPRSPWIISRAWDLVLFIATPLLILPLLWLWRQKSSPDLIYAFVTAFGATGHHLPGLMRAYGDRSLFRRFRLRFTLVPALLLATTLPLLFTELRQGMMVILVLWGFWHGLMQVYGFARIYDAKTRNHHPRTTRLDWLLCLSWFGVGLINSDGRVYQMLEALYQAGGPTLDPVWIDGFRNLWNAGTAVVTLAYILHLSKASSEGQSPNPLKLLTMAISFGYWWYAMVEVDNILYGIALFEIFHDVQYLAIVWVFNLKRVDGDPNVGSFSRFLFRRSGPMLGLYIGLIAGYGFLSNLQAQVTFPPIQNILIGLVWTSTLLHFYFDGFIWKVREKGTRAGLGISENGANDDSRPLTDGLLHASKWTPFVAAVAETDTRPVVGLGHLKYPWKIATAGTWRGPQHLVRVVPRYDHAHLTLGTRPLCRRKPGCSRQVARPRADTVRRRQCQSPLQPRTGQTLLKKTPNRPSVTTSALWNSPRSPTRPITLTLLSVRPTSR